MRKEVTKATILPIAGLLLSGIVGVIAVPEISRGLTGGDQQLAYVTSMIFVALVFGISILWAQRVLGKVSVVEQYDSIRGVNILLTSMHWTWFTINGIAFLSFLTSFYFAVSMGSYGYDADLGYDVYMNTANNWTALPLSILGSLILVEALVYMELRSKTIVPQPQPPVWMPPVYTPPAP